MSNFININENIANFFNVGEYTKESGATRLYGSKRTPKCFFFQNVEWPIDLC